MKLKKPCQSRAFTLVELLVVIGIITLLIGILLPVLSKARTQSYKVVCRANLADIGRSFTMYLTDHRQVLPHVEPLPAINMVRSPVPVWPVNWPPNPVPDWVSLRSNLDPYIKGGVNVWRCPVDQIGKTMATMPTYFERDGLSYLYNDALNPDSGTLPPPETKNEVWSQKLTLLRSRSNGRIKTDSDVWVIQDAENWHKGSDGKLGVNYLYSDMHVADLNR